jgi:hypothetical protein
MLTVSIIGRQAPANAVFDPLSGLAAHTLPPCAQKHAKPFTLALPASISGAHARTYLSIHSLQFYISYT